MVVHGATWGSGGWTRLSVDRWCGLRFRLTTADQINSPTAGRSLEVILKFDSLRLRNDMYA
jgi:hypothetical protein